MRGDEDADTGDLVEDAVAALPSLCYRLLFYPPGTRLRLAPPQLGRLFLSPRKLSPPQDARDCVLRLAANSWRFRAERAPASADVSTSAKRRIGRTSSAGGWRQFLLQRSFP